jgi:HEAT repeat protein
VRVPVAQGKPQACSACPCSPSLEEANEAVDKLKGLLVGETRDKSHVIRVSAAIALRKIGDRAQHAVQELVEALEKDERYEVRGSAAQAVAEMGRGAAEVLARTEPRKCNRMFEVLIQSLGDEDWIVRKSAAEALTLIGPQVITLLKEVFADPKASPKELVKQNAAEVLGRIDPWDSARGRIDPRAEDILPTLAALLNDSTLMGPPRAFAADAIKSAIPRFAAKAHSLTREELVVLTDSVRRSLRLADKALASVPNREVAEALRDIELKLKKREDELSGREPLAAPYGNVSVLSYSVLLLIIILSLSIFGLRRFWGLRRGQHPYDPKHDRTGRDSEPAKALLKNDAPSYTRVVCAGVTVETVDELRKPTGKQHARDQTAVEGRPNHDLPRNAIFISYASEDLPSVAQLVAGLEAEGLPVWFDKNRLKPGDSFNPKIEQYISRDCCCLVAVISQNTERLPEGYFRREWNLALDRSHSFHYAVRFIVPVIVDDTAEPLTVPPEFRRRTYIRLAGGALTRDFVEAIKETVRLVAEAKPAGSLG